MGCCHGSDRADQYGLNSLRFSTVSSVGNEKEGSVGGKLNLEEIEIPLDLYLERSKYSNIEYLQIVTGKIRNNEELAEMLGKDAVQDIIQNISKGSQALREKSVVFLYELAKFSNRAINNRIVKAGGLKVLVRWLQCENEQFRMSSTEVCYYLYKNNKNNQNEFIRLNGHHKLVQVLARCNENDSQVERVLTYIEALMTDSNKKTRAIVCEKLFDAMIWDVINNVTENYSSNAVRIKAKKLKIKIAEHLIQ